MSSSSNPNSSYGTAGLEKEMKELVLGYERDVKSLKKIAVCGVGMMLMYNYFSM
ncbi:unnamed protein product [Eruca vesicaria subsp. sativa]|uniref:Uncharacterized protein n=1 Tax=Eruca vesicaria subsp. sativa TaxID=29727 RepID=A0ABC8JCB1_ERUVS|nr:unnamed protein product [Eruca vesicaria subsp. sativa]